MESSKNLKLVPYGVMVMFTFRLKPSGERNKLLYPLSYGLNSITIVLLQG